MQLSGAPTKIAVPFANSGTKNTIPVASQIAVTPGAASFTDGFPPLTFTPIAAGGVPPFGADFNGILNAITQAVRWQMAGGTYLYDGTFSTAVGGYPKGAVLSKATGLGLWLNQTDNNTNNPDTGGAGWNDLTSGRLLRTSVYTLVTGVQNVSVDGGTPTSTGATTFTALSATTKVEIEVQAGGGGGGGVSTNGTSPATAGGGGAGSYGRGIYTSGFSSLAITVGAAGTAGAAGNNAGGAGNSSSAGALITAPGGAGGAGGAPNTAPFFNGGTAIGGAVAGANVYSQRGDAGRYGIVLQNANVAGGIGGASQFGAATASVANGPGGQALNYGAGGGGASALSALNINQAGGPGANGIVIIREYA